jgi:chaperone required for assembly of F1-ATPase
MPVMLERWNDDKMDALAAKVDILTVKVDGIEVKLGEQGQELRELRQEMKAGFDQIQRAMIHAVVGLSGSIVLGFATVIAAVLLGA